MKKNLKNFQINPTNFTRSISLILVLLMTSPFWANGQAGKPDFSGTWTLNADKSNLGDGGGQRFGGGDFKAVQEANLLSVERTRTNPDGETMTTTSKYTLDGKECVNTTGRGESKSTAKWSADGKALTIVTVSSFNGNERTSTEVWTLTDSKTISIASTRQGRDGEEVKTTRVYDKK